MNLAERKQAEDRVNAILEDLTKGEQAIVYKTLYALGFKIADCDDVIRREPAPQCITKPMNYPRNLTSQFPISQFHLSRGWPTNPLGKP